MFALVKRLKFATILVMTDANQLINKKRELLALVEAEAKTLRTQILALESAMAEDTDFANYLAQKKAKSAEAEHRAPEINAASTFSGRNPKGLIRKELLGVLAGGVERDLNYIEAAIKDKTPSPVARSALRAFLMKLRNEKIVTSSKAGLFQLAQKGETRL